MRAFFMVTSVVVLTALAGCSKQDNKGGAQGESKPGTETQAAPVEPKAEEAEPKKAEEGEPKAEEGEAKPEGEEAKPEAAEGDAKAGPITEEAKEVYAQRCATCHGADGQGDGAASAALNPKPRNYHDAEWQKSVTDQYLADIIVKGGAGVGKSAMMPPNPDLADKPEVVNGLVGLIRSFAKD